MEKFSKWLSPLVFVFFVAALGVTASTTIGTDITTGGNLDVTGNATVTGTLGVTGATTLSDLLTAADADFAGPVSVALGPNDEFFVADSDGPEEGAAVQVSCEEGDCEVRLHTAFGSNGGAQLTLTPDEVALSFEGGDYGYFLINATDGVQINGGGFPYVDVSGIRYGSSGGGTPYTCDGGDPVGIYFDTNDGEFCFCDGTAWGPIDQSSAANCTTNE